MRWRLAILTVLLLLPAGLPARADRLKVVASFSILGDMVKHIGGDRIELSTLVGPEADAHVFQAAPQHARAVLAARLFVINGRGFDAWARRLAKSTGSRARVVEATASLGKTGHDPHAWQDVSKAMLYVRSIASAMVAADGVNAEYYSANASGYIRDLQILDAQIRAGFAGIPLAQRRVITTHDAFGYFGAAYGITFSAPLGLSTESQPSAKGVATLITQIRREKITALFVENISDARLLGQIARETGVVLGGKLYSDALSRPEGPAPDYISLMRHNAGLLTGAMSDAS